MTSRQKERERRADQTFDLIFDVGVSLLILIAVKFCFDAAAT